MQNHQKPAALIVEDDPLVRLVAVDIVEEAGYRAIEAAGADEAVAMLEGRSDITVLLTDVNMPGSMDGVKLAHAVKNRWPPVQIIMVSGRLHGTQSDLPADTQFFAKPYCALEIISHLRALIGD